MALIEKRYGLMGRILGVAELPQGPQGRRGRDPAPRPSGHSRHERVPGRGPRSTRPSRRHRRTGEVLWRVRSRRRASSTSRTGTHLGRSSSTSATKLATLGDPRPAARRGAAGLGTRSVAGDCSRTSTSVACRWLGDATGRQWVSVGWTFLGVTTAVTAVAGLTSQAAGRQGVRRALVAAAPGRGVLRTNAWPRSCCQATSVRRWTRDRRRRGSPPGPRALLGFPHRSVTRLLGRPDREARRARPTPTSCVGGSGAPRAGADDLRVAREETSGGATTGSPRCASVTASCASRRRWPRCRRMAGWSRHSGTAWSSWMPSSTAGSWRLRCWRRCRRGGTPIFFPLEYGTGVMRFRVRRYFSPVVARAAFRRALGRIRRGHVPLPGARPLHRGHGQPDREQVAALPAHGEIGDRRRPKAK